MQYEFLKELGIKPVNQGACSGPGTWSSTTGAGVLESFNPATGELIAKVNLCSEADYEQVLTDMQTAFIEWRQVPAPKRGEIVRQMGDALRAKKDALGNLVAL
ncbi:MAG TPA: aldehyde dehydrogenase family protein, partial [Candidatus Marinimicrobia bacterium]|nr:aldehyde dehydrogenase family protein [Candidatus Neomarinimicrobiota bacterium]